MLKKIEGCGVAALVGFGVTASDARSSREDRTAVELGQQFVRVVFGFENVFFANGGAGGRNGKRFAFVVATVLASRFEDVLGGIAELSAVPLIEVAALASGGSRGFAQVSQTKLRTFFVVIHFKGFEELVSISLGGQSVRSPFFV